MSNISSEKIISFLMSLEIWIKNVAKLSKLGRPNCVLARTQGVTSEILGEIKQNDRHEFLSKFVFAKSQMRSIIDQLNAFEGYCSLLAPEVLFEFLTLEQMRQMSISLEKINQSFRSLKYYIKRLDDISKCLEWIPDEQDTHVANQMVFENTIPEEAVFVKFCQFKTPCQIYSVFGPLATHSVLVDADRPRIHIAALEAHIVNSLAAGDVSDFFFEPK